jgi:hypothetical protein
MDYRSSSLLSVSCYRLVTNFQETNRQQETHARRDERTVTSKHLFHVERSLLIPNFFINLLNRFHLRGPPVLHLGEDKDNMEKTLITFIPSFATFACGGSGDLAPRARSKK